MTPPTARPDAQALLSHAGWMRALVRKLLVQEDQVDEVMQQTWLAALEHPPERPALLRRWLGTVTRNSALRYKRGEGRRLRREQVAAFPEATPSAAETVERAHAHQQVVQAVMSLTEPYRTVVLMRYFEEREPIEIAERLGVPASTVRSQLKRGLAALRARLQDEFGSDWKASCLILLAVRPGAAAVPATTTAGTSLLLATGAVLMKLKLSALAVAAVVLSTSAFLFLDSPEQLDHVELQTAAKGRAAPDAAPFSATETETPQQREKVSSPAAVVGEGEIEIEELQRRLMQAIEERGEPTGFYGYVVTPDGRPVPPDTTVYAERVLPDGQVETLSQVTAEAGGGNFFLPRHDFGSLDIHDLQGIVQAAYGVEDQSEEELPRFETWTLYATTPDEIEGRLGDVIFERGTSIEGLEIRLERVPLFRGRVVRADEPEVGVAGAQVDLEVGVPGWLSAGSYRIPALTDPNGYFGVAAKTADEGLVSVTVHAPDHAPAWLNPDQLAEAEQGKFLVIPVHRGATLEGQVIDALGAPVEEGTPVHWNYAHEPGHPLTDDVFWEYTETDADGHFRFENLPPGPSRVGVGITERIEYEEGVYSQDTENLDGVVDLDLEAGREHFARVQLKPKQVIQGRLAFNQHQAEPRERRGWEVSFLDDQGRIIARAPVHEDGRFELQVETHEPGYLIARKSKLAPSIVFGLAFMNSQLTTAADAMRLSFDEQQETLGLILDAAYEGDEAQGGYFLQGITPYLVDEMDVTAMEEAASALVLPQGAVTFEGSRFQVYNERMEDVDEPELYGFAVHDKPVQAPARGVVIDVAATCVEFAPCDEEELGPRTRIALRVPPNLHSGVWAHLLGGASLAIPSDGLSKGIRLMGLPPGAYTLELRSGDELEEVSLRVLNGPTVFPPDLPDLLKD